MRLLLIANVRAQTVTPRKIRFIERALASQATVELVHTTRQGHAMELSREAAAAGVDVVAVLGGDGTVNEGANGLAGTGVPLGIIPGGGANVFARSLGIPRDPVRAAGKLLARLGTDPTRLSLGRAAGRHFTFSCGIGLDGEIIRRVERRQHLKRVPWNSYFAWTAVRVGLFAYDLRAPLLRLRWEGGERDGMAFAMAQNGSPFTYFFGRPMHLSPGATRDAGLDCFAVGNISPFRLIRMALQALTTRRHVRDPRVHVVRGQSRIEIHASRTLPVQMDGEFVGEHERLDLESVPGALSVLA